MFSELSKKELNRLFVMDEYGVENSHFKVYGYDIEVKDALIAEALTHIMKSSHGRCTREELSSQLHYNGEYLNRIIKKYTGKTILEYKKGSRAAG